MKTVTFYSILFAMLLVLTTCAGINSRSGQGRIFRTASSTGLVDGIYEGSARAYRGMIHVRLVISGGMMAEIDILDSDEDLFVGAAAIDELLEQVLMYNTTDLDAVSGATESSEGFLAALQDALRLGARDQGSKFK